MSPMIRTLYLGMQRTREDSSLLKVSRFFSSLVLFKVRCIYTDRKFYRVVRSLSSWDESLESLVPATLKNWRAKIRDETIAFIKQSMWKNKKQNKAKKQKQKQTKQKTNKTKTNKKQPTNQPTNQPPTNQPNLRLWTVAASDSNLLYFHFFVRPLWKTEN